MNYCIITTINLPTKSIEKLYDIFGERLIVVGDKKTPKDWKYKEAQYILDLPDQKGYYEGYAPCNSYARKNIGYMAAIKNKAELIFETDDDNIPNMNWRLRGHQVEANLSLGEGWFNVYDVFTKKYIWPRGFSLRHLKNCPSIGEKVFRTSSIQQGLADGEPDVDAIWRLVLNSPNEFTVKQSLYLQKNSWCSFNSQSTWWFPRAYALMYLPVYSSFRMCDIWRSFIAQRCLWELSEGVTFHSPSEVFQERNEHDLLKDLEDEVDGYLNNDEIVEILSKLILKPGDEYVCENLLTCYQAIVDKDILPEMEIRSLKKWIKDYEQFT